MLGKNLAHIKIYKMVSMISTGAILLIAVFFVPKGVPFWQFSTSDVLNLLISLLLVSLFIERSMEVIFLAWRGKAKQAIKTGIDTAKRKSQLESKGDSPMLSSEEEKGIAILDQFSAETRSLSMLTGLGLGIVVSALGIRAVEPLVDPAVLKNLGHVQKALFTGADTFLTGALLGGGSDGIHNILDTFLSLVLRYRKKVKSEI